MATKRKRDLSAETQDKKPCISAVSGEDGSSSEGDMDLSQRPGFITNIKEEAEVGIIEHVHIKNFMCHSEYDQPLGANVNFLIGRNGSGKSAILTAIVVGLGGKANVTNRGSSIKNFIKDGKHSGEVSIKLRNRGQDAYKPEVYGDSIIVNRKLSKESSQYKLKSATGQVVSTKREELTNILESFNIQVDNPIVVLNQDMSKHFLHSKNPGDKYKFFLKATQLEQMRLDYMKANESKRIAIDILEKKKETLPTLENEVIQWEQKYKALASLEELKNKMSRLRNELIWALISEREKMMEPNTKQLRTEEARTPKFLQKVTESETALASSKENQAAIERDLTTLGLSVADIEPEYQRARADKEAHKKAAKASQQEINKVNKDVRNNNRDKEQILERIAQIQDSQEADYEQEKATRLAKMAALEGQIKEVTAMKTTTEHDHEQYHRAAAQLKRDHGVAKAAAQLKRDHGVAKSEIDEKTRRLTQLRRNLQNLEASRSNHLRRFGSYVPALVQKIDDACNRGVFHQRPRGPIGAHFTLRDQKWALGVESCLKSLMFAFCCHDHHDERELEKILNQVCSGGKKPSTITSQFQHQVYDVSRNRPETSRYPTVLEVLDIKDPVVANCLIDQRMVEAVLLIEDQEESRTVMSRNPPRKAREAFNKDGDQIHSNPFRYYSSTDDKAKILVSSVEEDIQHHQREVAQCEDSVKRSRESLTVTNRDLQRTQTEERKAQGRVMKLTEQIGKIQMELAELSNIEEPTPVDVQTLEAEVSRLDAQTARLQDALRDRQAAHEAANREFLAVEEQFQKLDADMRGISEKTDAIQEQLAHAENQITMAKSHKAHYEGKLKSHMKTIGELKKKQETYLNELKEETSKAQAICERVKTKRSSQNLESEIKQIGKQITLEEKNRGNFEEITLNYKQTKDKFIEIRKEVGQLQNFLKRMTETLLVRELRYKEFVRLRACRVQTFFVECVSTRGFVGKLQISHKLQTMQPLALSKVMVHRDDQYRQFREMIASRAKLFFVVTLNARKYKGKMMIDHRKETLDLTVSPVADTQDPAKDMRSLSGGERSFSTVCFILSLWEAMESPFRCLDEFDVFMDMVNRRISMDMMMSAAMGQKTHQFVFLTPQDMSHVSVDRSIVRIFQMIPPVRGQGTLPYRRQGEEDEEEDGTAAAAR